MITITIPYDALELLDNAIELTHDMISSLQVEIIELEAIKKWTISPEAFQLATAYSREVIVKEQLEELQKLKSMMTEDFVTQAKADSSISSSQPYNAGSRENY
jgi:hypothetical protein